MKLWIRSQDKRHLMKADYVSIMEKNIINAASSGWDYDVAKYKSEERALEVLDEIQNILYKISDPDLEDVPDLTKLYIPPIIIYEMPEE